MARLRQNVYGIRLEKKSTVKSFAGRGRAQFSRQIRIDTRSRINDFLRSSIWKNVPEPSSAILIAMMKSEERPKKGDRHRPDGIGRASPFFKTCFTLVAVSGFVADDLGRLCDVAGFQ